MYQKHTELIQKLHTDQMIDAWGDGLKTYTNAIYHIDHDSTLHWFEGMNYPYGEHIVPATELPGVAIFLKLLKPIFPNISDYVVSVVHFEMLLALLLCGLFMFLIFREIGLPVWYSLLVGIGVAFLSPQNVRMTSHYGLAQQFVIPCLFYLLLLYHKNPNWWKSFWVAFVIFVSSFLHFYFFAITVFFVSGYVFFRVIFNFKKEQWKTILPHYFLMTFVPLIFFWFWMLGADAVTDRSPHPYGFFYYSAIWESIFTNPQLPYFQWIDDNIIAIEKVKDFEGVAYIGLPAVLFSLVFLVRWLIGRFDALLKRLSNRFVLRNPKQLQKPLFPFIKENYLFYQSIFLSALSLLFFSFAWPFSIPGLETFVDDLGPIRQFRSLGRFAWIFYYVINIFAFWGIYDYLYKQKTPILKWGALATIFAIFGYEIWSFNQKINLKLYTVPYFNRGIEFTDIDSIDFTKYQAILPIPYFNVGSNNFSKGIEGFISQRSYVLSTQTGLPNMGSMLTRSSRNQTFRQWQMLKEPYRIPIIFEDFESDKPLLILWWEKMKPHDYQVFKHLLQGGDLIFEKDDLQLFEITKQDFINRIENKKLAIQNELDSNLFTHQNLLSTDSLENFIYKNFDTKNEEKPYFGKGSFKGILNQKNEILNQQIPNQNKDSIYHFQAWVWVDKDRFAKTLFNIQEFDSAGNQISQKRFHVWPKVRTFDPKGWALVEIPFRLKSNDSKLRISFDNPELGTQEIWVDELLIKPLNTSVYQIGKDWIWKNNLHYLD